MRRHHGLATLGVVLGVLAVASPGVAQGRPGAARGRDAAAPLYDTTTVRTLRGTVVGIDTIPGPRALGGGIHVQFRTGSETIPVHLGPSWYMNQQQLRLQIGEEITVRGSRITYAGAPAIVAAEVTRRGASVRLRDRSGLPVWSRNFRESGRGRRMP